MAIVSIFSPLISCQNSQFRSFPRSQFTATSSNSLFISTESPVLIRWFMISSFPQRVSVILFTSLA
nr:MAG TPA: hypothetical protein [Caudoviricetes sp.]